MINKASKVCAFNGAIGAAGGALGGKYAIGAAITVGIISGGVTAYNTEGDIQQKAAVGVSTAVVSGLGTYYGTLIPVATESVFDVAFTSFCGTMFAGTQAAIVNVVVTNTVSNLFQSANTSSTSSGSTMMHTRVMLNHTMALAKG